MSVKMAVTEGASWAGFFEEDYATVDWSQTAREIHNQVRAWHLAFQDGPVQGPFTEVDGERVKIKRSSLTDPGDGSPAHENRRRPDLDSRNRAVRPQPLEVR